MGKVSKNQRGYSTVEVLLLAVIVLVIGFVGWYVYKSSNNAYDTLNSAPNTNIAPRKKGAPAPKASTAKPSTTTNSTPSKSTPAAPTTSTTSTSVTTTTPTPTKQ